MRAVMLEVPESLLEERRRKGWDRHDEMWDGVLHMVPPPAGWHQEFGGELYVVVKPRAKTLGLVAAYEIGLFRRDIDFRQPDIAVYHPRFRSKRGIEGADFVIEILSPNDESREKLPWYLDDIHVPEVLLANPDTRAVELYVPGQGKPKRLEPDANGAVKSAVLGMSFTPVAGPKLRIAWEGGSAEI